MIIGCKLATTEYSAEKFFKVNLFHFYCSVFSMNNNLNNNNNNKNNNHDNDSRQQIKTSIMITSITIIHY